MKKFPKIVSILLFIVCGAVLAAGVFCAPGLPRRLQSDRREDIPLRAVFPMVASPDGMTAETDDCYSARMKLFGVIPISSATVQVVADQYVIPGGFPFGVKILAEGAMVVSVNSVQTGQGAASPGHTAGVRAGDVILALNNTPLTGNAQLQALLQQSGGEPVTLALRRDGKDLTVTLTPVQDAAGQWRAGLWVRDSAAGLGTMTFYHPQTGWYGGLGHGVCDVDTGEAVPVQTGQMVAARINGVQKAAPGHAGELVGALESDRVLALLDQNNACGVYGPAAAPPTGETVRVARKQEVTTGPATVLACVSGQVEAYTCRIESVDLRDDTEQNMVICMTDARLLQAAGGIVQGMSGSPVLQNGRLIGAVTHVFLHDPTRGYGVFAQTMLETVVSADAARQRQKAS